VNEVKGREVVFVFLFLLGGSNKAYKADSRFEGQARVRNILAFVIGHLFDI